MEISQILAALTKIAFLGFSISLRADVPSFLSSNNHHSKAWVSSRIFLTEPTPQIKLPFHCHPQEYVKYPYFPYD
ncbi:hypothetical protein NM43_2090 [Neisseria meningitidis NM43]|nr:hypothetical protein NM43_2090 [Neisseria meningitidis NM43]EOC23551.1 hypothetical protein NM2001072_2106 [Neisseria meningitidis 2001072]